MKEGNTDLSRLIAVMEEVIQMKGLNRRMPTDERKEDYKEKPSDNVLKKVKLPECYNCGETGHKRPDCTKPRKKINNVQVDSEEEEEN